MPLHYCKTLFNWDRAHFAYVHIMLTPARSLQYLETPAFLLDGKKKTTTTKFHLSIISKKQINHLGSQEIDINVASQNTLKIDMLCKICQNTVFSLTHIFLYKDRIYNSVLIWESTVQRKPLCWYILHSDDLAR